MPESKCRVCGVTHWDTTQERLLEWELKHHRDSFKRCSPGSLLTAVGIEGFHMCRSFQQLSNETGWPITGRIYNYGRLVETITS